MLLTLLRTHKTNSPQSGIPIRVVTSLMVLLSFMLVTSNGNAQSIDSLLNNADSLFRSRNLDSAIVLAELALGKAESEFETNDTAIASVLRLAVRYNYIAGRYDQSEMYCRQSLTIRQTQTEQDDFEIAKDFRSLGSILYQLAQYSSAESTYTQSLQLMETSLGPNHVEVAKTVGNLALVYVNQGHLEKALQLHKRALEIKEAAQGIADSEIARSYNNLASVYSKLGDYQQSEHFYRLALEIKEKDGAGNLSLLSSLNNLANLLKLQARYPEAENLLRRALTICENHLGLEHQYVGSILGNLAGVLSRQARYVEAEELYLRSLDIVEHNLGADHPNVATVLTSLSNLMRLTGRFQDAESHLMRSLEIRKEVLGPSHYDIANNLNSLATLYRLRGIYADAELLYNQAISMYMETLGEDHPEVGNAIMAQANLKFDQGQYSEAEVLYRKANQIFKSSYGPDHPTLGLGYQNLANLFYENDRDEEAEYLYRQALVISMESDGYEHPGSALIMFNLGSTLDRQGKLDEADSMMTEALNIRRRLLGPRHRDIGFSLSGLSRVRIHQGQFDSAESMLGEALSILTESLGPAHPELAIIQKDLAELLARKGDYADALQFYGKSFELKRNFLDYAFSFSSEGQKLRWLGKYPLLDDATFSLAMLTSERDALQLAGNMILSGKSAVVDAMMSENVAIACAEDPDLRALAQQRAELGTRLANLALAAVSEDQYQDFGDTLNSLVQRLDSIDTDLSRRCAGFSREKRHHRIDVDEVAKALPEGSVLWEYLRYQPNIFDSAGTINDHTAPARHLGLVLSHSAELFLVDLGPADFIDSLVHTIRQKISHAGARVFSPIGQHLETQLKSDLQVLYNQIFAPMIACQDDITKIYVSPDGVLNLLPLQILTMNDGAYVIEDYSITYLSSGRDLLGMDQSGFKTSSFAMMLADPDFDNMDTTLVNTFDLGQIDLLPNETLRPMSPMASCLDADFLPLTHSRDEVISATSILQQAGVSTKEFYGIQASETRLKSMEQPPWILHVATHGLFCEDTTKFNASRVYNVLVSNGLALAGVNARRGENLTSRIMDEDGFLTALEVSGLNLMGTQLTFLAACETGVGVIVNGEGVYGLRRAFHHAGTQSLVMSLWRAPDLQTSELTTMFYQNWLNGFSRGEALRQAALEIINNSRSTRGFAHPLLWGGFVLMGNSN